MYLLNLTVLFYFYVYNIKSMSFGSYQCAYISVYDTHTNIHPYFCPHTHTHTHTTHSLSKELIMLLNRLVCMSDNQICRWVVRQIIEYFMGKTGS